VLWAYFPHSELSMSESNNLSTCWRFAARVLGKWWNTNSRKI